MGKGCRFGGGSEEGSNSMAQAVSKGGETNISKESIEMIRT